MAGTNYDKLINHIGKEHSPFIVYDVETTGIMNGNDNCITQMALTFYDYNKENGKYELQDELFMLAKPNEEIIRAIQEGEKVTKENIEHRLAQDFSYSFVKNEKAEVQKLERQLAHDEKYPKQHSKEELDDLRNRIALENDALATALSVYETRKVMFDNGMSIDEVFSTPIFEDTISPQVLEDCRDYISKNYEAKKEEMEETISVADTLAKQGLDLEKYIKDGLGLTTAEMQVGITEFLNKYCKENTVFVNNGTYFSKHYMDKEGLTLLGKDEDKEKVIDLTQAQRSMKGGVSRWTADIETFAKNYKEDTGKEIKTFDALTKALCIGESVTKACDMRVSLTSENYLEKKVSESAFSKDNDYVMSLARATTLKWNIANESTFRNADYHFNSLEYVNFGNDRRYVDIDKMFKMNDNFEITLDGEKTPIKTWEELEAKIKSLNAEISDELLDKIHEKYDEITKEADKRWKEDLEIRFNDGTLSADKMTAEEYEYLDSVYDISYEDESESIDFNPYDYETREDAMDSLNMYHAEGLISDDDYKSYVIEIDECEEYKDDEEIEEEPKSLTIEEQAEELLRQYDELNKKKETLDTKISDLTEQNRQFCEKLGNVMENLLVKRNEIYENIGLDTTGKNNWLIVSPTETYNVNYSRNRENDYKIYLCLKGTSDSLYLNNPKFNEIISKFDINEETITNAFWVQMNRDIQNAITEKSKDIEKLESKVETMETFKIDKGNKNKSKGEER